MKLIKILLKSLFVCLCGALGLLCVKAFVKNQGKQSGEPPGCGGLFRFAAISDMYDHSPFTQESPEFQINVKSEKNPSQGKTLSSEPMLLLLNQCFSNFISRNLALKIHTLLNALFY